MADWGPVLWYEIHKLAYDLPDTITVTHKSHFVNSLVNIILQKIKCINCQVHACQYIIDNLRIDDLNTKKSIQLFTYYFHDAVNIRLQKVSITKEQFLATKY
jgi:hypothetical protein